MWRKPSLTGLNEIKKMLSETKTCPLFVWRIYPPLCLFTRLWRGGKLSNLSAALFGGNSCEFLIDFNSN